MVQNAHPNGACNNLRHRLRAVLASLRSVHRQQRGLVLCPVLTLNLLLPRGCHFGPVEACAGNS